MSRDSKGSVKISAGAVVCNESELRGDITIGARTVIHPKAKILAESGPIIIGNLTGDCFQIFEYFKVLNRFEALKMNLRFDLHHLCFTY